MGQMVYRANLGSKAFPLISENFGQSVILKQFDQNYVKGAVNADDLDDTIGIPQCYYCHNVIATAQGYQSVGYRIRTPALAPNEEQFKDIKTIHDVDNNKAFITLTQDGRIYVARYPEYYWISTPVSGSLAGRTLYIANIEGRSLIYISNIGCYEYDFDTNLLVSVSLTGLDTAQTIGIIASQGYLIAWSKTAVAWSSTVDPTDFVPSLITGAGGGSVEGAESELTVLVAYNQGFVAYTASNAVIAVYSGNSRYPFNFKTANSTGGVTSGDLISFDSGSPSHWVYSSSGLQQVSANVSTIAFPEITDFISGKYFEDFDEVTMEFTYTELDVDQALIKKLTVVSDRYLVISYGLQELTHALLYDLGLKRFGKFKITHSDCFEWRPLNQIEADAPRESIGFLKKDGQILVADLSPASDVSSGAILLGRYQHARTRLISIQEIRLDVVRVNRNFKGYILNQLSEDYTTQIPTPMYQSVIADKHRIFNSNVTGTNQTIVGIGSFSLTSVILKYIVNGRR